VKADRVQDGDAEAIDERVERRGVLAPGGGRALRCEVGGDRQLTGKALHTSLTTRCWARVRKAKGTSLRPFRHQPIDFAFRNEGPAGDAHEPDFALRCEPVE
jgi:hypothetical protein